VDAARLELSAVGTSVVISDLHSGRSAFPDEIDLAWFIRSEMDYCWALERVLDRLQDVISIGTTRPWPSTDSKEEG
jgi:hypothetical protein